MICALALAPAKPWSNSWSTIPVVTTKPAPESTLQGADMRLG